MHRPPASRSWANWRCVQAKREEAKRNKLIHVETRWCFGAGVPRMNVPRAIVSKRMEMRGRRLGCGAIGRGRMTGEALPRNTSLAILRFCATTDALRDWVWRGRFGVYAFTASSHFTQKDSILTPPYAKIAPLHVLCMLWTTLTSACNTPLITLSACTLLCVAKRLLAPGSVQYACMCECVNVFGVCLQFSFLLFRLRHCYR